MRNPRGFHHGGFALPVGKSRGFVLVGIYAAELLAILIGDGDKPMMMLASLIGVEILSFARLGLFRNRFHGTPSSANMRLSQELRLCASTV